jgi:hypothetical protein
MKLGHIKISVSWYVNVVDRSTTCKSVAMSIVSGSAYVFLYINPLCITATFLYLI